MANRDRLRALMEENGVDALLVSSTISNYYLLGYKTISPEDRDLWSLVTKKGIYSYTHDLNFPLLQEHASTGEITPLLMNYDNPLSKQIADIAKKEDIKTIGIEAEDLRVAELELFQKQIKKFNSHLTWKKTQKLIYAIRAIKDDVEIDLLRNAAHLADESLTDIVKTIREGQSELEIARKLVAWFREKGYEPSFEPIVAIGKNAAIPHYDSVQNSGRVTLGSLILIDFGVIYKHYCSDTTRVLFYGKPTSEIENTYTALLKAQEETIKNLPTFKQAKEADNFCRNILKKEGVPSTYPHVTGHGVGLQVHELPTIHFRSENDLKSGQVVTIEPGIYHLDKYGMRIEDTVAIKDEGVEVLSQFPKTLQVIG